MRHEGLEKLKAGDFNYMSQEPHPDGSVIITLASYNYPEVYRFRVKDLYGPKEKVVGISPEPPPPKE